MERRITKSAPNVAVGRCGRGNRVYLQPIPAIRLPFNVEGAGVAAPVPVQIDLIERNGYRRQVGGVRRICNRHIVRLYFVV
jgi:hypothetical protein